MTLIVFLLPIGVKTGILIAFKINQKRIAEELCIQKDIEENTCQGTCHLSKQIEQVNHSTNEDEQSPVNSKSENQVQLSLTPSFGKLLLADFQSVDYTKHYFHSSLHISSPHLEDVFHPPNHHCVYI